MPLVNVMVNSRAYTIACDEGEEDHLRELAGRVDQKVKELLGSVGQVGDQRLLLMAALLIADELSAAKKEMGKLTEEGDPAGEAMLAESLEELANRVEAIAVRIEAA